MNITPLDEQPISPDARDHLAQERVVIVLVPPELHPDTKQLVQVFAETLARKLRAAEEKYGRRDGWLKDDWEKDCRRGLREHLEKGDPVDVAIYAAFMWARGWSTA
jgi:hypothetical protein